MPKPCSKPVKSNPFETYRDPETGRWEVKYPASDQPGLCADIVPAASLEHCDVEYLKHKQFFLEGSFPLLRPRWKSKSRPKVVA